MKWFQAHKYLVLLTIIIFALLSQSHIHGLEIAFAYIVLLVVFVSVFQHRWDRLVGLLLGIPTMAAEVVFRVVPRRPHRLAGDGGLPRLDDRVPGVCRGDDSA